MEFATHFFLRKNNRFVVAISCIVLLNSLCTKAPAAERQRSTKILWTVDWSAGDRYFAVGGEGFLRIYDGDTQKLHSWNAPEIRDTVRHMKWHDSKPLLAVSSGPDDTGIYDVESGNFVQLKTAEGTRGIAWNSDHTKIATAGNDGALQIWSSSGGLLHRYKPENGKSLTGVAWHPRKDILVSIGEFITVHNGDGSPMRNWSHRPDSEGFQLLLSAQWHPSGEFFVVGDYGNTDTDEPPALQFWSVDFMLIKSIEIKSGAEFRNIDWNDDGSLLATASDKLSLWTKDGKLVKQTDVTNPLWGICWSRAEDRILTSSLEEEIDLWTPAGKHIERVHPSTD